jgi:proteasome lid subunit RPN8/RPN11
MVGNNKLIFPVNYYEELVNHGQSQLPYEACGLLSGRNQTVQSIWKLKNELNSDRRFFVGEKTVNKTLQSIAKRDEKVLAIYHSHPTTAPVPSYTDVLNHPDVEVKMIIVSYKTKNPLVKCYHIQKGSYKELPFLIEPFV